MLADLESTITNVTCDCGVHRYTSIDHILVRRHTRISETATIPSPSSHCLLFAVVETDRRMPDVRSWKFMAWRRASESQITSLSGVLDIVWGLMTFMLLPPNAYLWVMWRYAKHFIPTPMSSKEVQAHMSRLAPRYSHLQLLSIANMVREAALLRGSVNKGQVLSTASITSATGAKPLRAYKGITTRPGVVMANPEARTQEVRSQAMHTTLSTHQKLNVGYFAAHQDTSLGRDSFLPARHLPLSLLGDILFAGVDPTEVSQTQNNARRLAVGPPLIDESGDRSVTTPGSPFASLDQVPQALLSRSGHESVRAVQRQVALMAHHLPSVSQRSVQQGINKGKGISHLYEGHRPVPLTSPLLRAESRVAQRRLASTRELSGCYTQSMYSYGCEVRPAFMALALRVVQTHTLQALAGCIVWTGMSRTHRRILAPPEGRPVPSEFTVVPHVGLRPLVCTVLQQDTGACTHGRWLHRALCA